jgi:hypothetical protein
MRKISSTPELKDARDLLLKVLSFCFFTVSLEGTNRKLLKRREVEVATITMDFVLIFW